MEQLQLPDRLFVHNSPTEWLIALGVAAATVVVLALAKRYAVRFLERFAAQTSTSFDDAVLCAARVTRPFIMVVLGAYFGGQYLELPDKVGTGLEKVLVVALVLQGGLWVWALVRFWLERAREHALAENPAAATGLAAVGFIARVLVWTIVLLMVLDNLGVNVTAMVAGLGIGGIAVALAVQNILGDLFASLSIVIDKPFVIGDFIVIDKEAGTVEYVGLKTTRIRSLSGEQVVISNSDLLKTRIHNFKLMRERRVVFTFGVRYETPIETLEKIPAMVRAIIEARPKVRFERAHLKGLGASGLDFEVVYWMLEPDFNLYMDVQQTINLEMLRAFSGIGVDIAYPTQSIILDGPIQLERARRAQGAKGDGADVEERTHVAAARPSRH
jgi:small-conductance mechanosensitive channel